MKVHEFEIIVKKLGMNTRDSKHRHAFFVHNGVRVVKTMRSHGDGKFIPEHKISKQLRVSMDQLAGLHTCSVSKDAYVQILRAKGILAEESRPTLGEKHVNGKIKSGKSRG
jgi:hypothetical protein